MKLTDMDFFHQATQNICGSLDINKVLNRCLDYFSRFMPLDSIIMNIYEPEIEGIVNIATVGSVDVTPSTGPVPLPYEARQYIKADKDPSVDIINNPEQHFIARFLWKASGKKKASTLVLKLVVDDANLGVVAFLAKGYDQYTLEHARLLELVHDPFAIALANTLKHQEVLRLKDLLIDDNQYLNRQLREISGDEIIGSDFGLKQVMEQVRQIAPQKSMVLLLGETGVGKEIIANAIHYSSPRASGPFIKVNCGAIPENLIDSELFGYEKGAFTGALSLKRGRFERADKGTLFLDEIGELPLSAQVRLLRVLQNKEIERVGGTNPIPVDVRIITATHRNLPEMVSQGTFREDLWFRLNVFPISIPPLRERKLDIPAFTRYFMGRKTREMNLTRQPVLAPGALEKLQSYDWPGNVRELENMVERSIIQNMIGGIEKPLEFDTILTPPIKSKQPLSSNLPYDSLPLDEIIKNHIIKVLQITDGKVQGDNGAAALLKTNPSTLRNKMKKLGIPYGRKVK